MAGAMATPPGVAMQQAAKKQPESMKQVPFSLLSAWRFGSS